MASDFRVGNWVVRPERLCIHLPGTTVHITPKSMAVLECLAEARGDVVSRNDILDKVWPGAAVTDDVLTQCVVELRKAFDDSASDPQYIETIPRKGLRLVAPVSEPEQVSAGWRSRRAVVAAVVAIAIIGIAATIYINLSRDAMTVAVLQFEDLSLGRDNGFFAAGLTEQLIDNLTELDGIAVGEPIGADFFVSGSVRQTDDELRVTAKLTNVATGLIEWSGTYSAVTDEELFEVQQETSAAIVEMLGVGLGVSEIAVVEGGTTNTDAYEAFKSGNAIHIGGLGIPNEALEHYERAVEHDPGFALAWAKIAEACLYAERREELRLYERRENALAKALELAPHSERILDTAAKVMIADARYVEARRLLDDIHELYEGQEIPYSETYLDLSIKMGRLGDANQAVFSIRDREGESAVNPVLLNQFFLIVDQADRALEEAERWYEDGYRAYLPGTTVPIALASGRIDEIEKWLRRLHEYQKEFVLHPVTPAELLLENLHDQDAVREILRQRGSIYGDMWLSQWAAYVGDEELALEVLQRNPMPWVFWSPIFRDIRKTDEFKQILIDIGMVDYWREFGWGNFCSPLDDDDFECA